MRIPSTALFSCINMNPLDSYISEGLLGKRDMAQNISDVHKSAYEDKFKDCRWTPYKNFLAYRLGQTYSSWGNEPVWSTFYDRCCTITADGIEIDTLKNSGSPKRFDGQGLSISCVKGKPDLNISKFVGEMNITDIPFENLEGIFADKCEFDGILFIQANRRLTSLHGLENVHFSKRSEIRIKCNDILNSLDGLPKCNISYFVWQYNGIQAPFKIARELREHLNKIGVNASTVVHK